jgi:hypothetical protein
MYLVIIHKNHLVGCFKSFLKSRTSKNAAHKYNICARANAAGGLVIEFPRLTAAAGWRAVARGFHHCAKGEVQSRGELLLSPYEVSRCTISGVGIQWVAQKFKNG